jgi:VWFA-related protein
MYKIKHSFKSFSIILIISCFTILSLKLHSTQSTNDFQKIQHEATAINIEVPVRVFKGDLFVDTLTIDDFELYENGKLQDIEAVYLIKKTDIERKEENKKFAPKTGRQFYLFFEISYFDPRIAKAIEFFIGSVLTPMDECAIVTPLKTYTLKSTSFYNHSKEKIADDLKTIIRKDAWMGSSEYRSALFDVKDMVRGLSNSQLDVTQGQRLPEGRLSTYEIGLDQSLTNYAAVLNKLESMRRVDQKKLLDFADYLKQKDGQKYVYLFYQSEYIPTIDLATLHKILATQNDPNIEIMATSLFGFYRRDVPVDVELVKRAYADSSIAIHFLFFSKLPEHTPGIAMEEHSEDIFNVFNDMAVATGGLTMSSANPEYLFKSAFNASDNYYLIYYTPKDYKADFKFKNIEVQVKTGNYRVTHRIGYFAN